MWYNFKCAVFIYIYLTTKHSLEKLLSEIKFWEAEFLKTARMKTKQMKPAREYSKHASQSG